jgi:4-hydroxybenzoate polyprenyltransferase
MTVTKSLINEHIKDRARQYWLLARFDRPIGTLILLWPLMGFMGC